MKQFFFKTSFSEKVIIFWLRFTYPVTGVMEN